MPKQLSLLDWLDGPPVQKKSVRRRPPPAPKPVIAPAPLADFGHLFLDPPGTSRADDLVFQIKRDLAILREDPWLYGDDEFFLQRIAQNRTTVERLRG